jgi:prevent-host-death family protein
MEDRMNKIGAREARLNFADVLNQTAFGKNRIILTKNGKDVAALVPIEDLQAIEEMEDRIDNAEASRIMRNPKLRDWETVKGELAGSGRLVAKRKVASKK